MKLIVNNFYNKNSLNPYGISSEGCVQNTLYIQNFNKILIARDFILLKIRSYVSRVLLIGYLDINKDYTKLHYYENEQKFCVVFENRRGPKSITNVFVLNDDKDIEMDVTENFKECLGFSSNFHGIPTTPKMLGYEKCLRVYYNKKDELGNNMKYDYSPEELIKINL